jgi:meiotically up-regulated gene 157 (Mug157) protein
MREIARMLENMDAGTLLMHEGVFKDDPGQFTRPWFAWANSIFSEFVEKAVDSL